MDEITKHHYRNIATGNAKKNKDGSLSTVSTRQVDLLDETGKRVPTLIPSIWDGKMLSEEEAVKKAKASGKKWPTAKTHAELRKFDIKIHEDMKPIPAESAASALEEAEVRESASAAKEFVTGGVVPMKNMKQQMELFADGGLMDEGGTVDPVSGNEVPPGSTQEEVRDDIPAQLSEGEFVFPADVVRYFGLEKLMQMRQEAKVGLARMEAMGQMGNADEATIPDDLPFTIDDLDTEDEEEYNNMAVGGMPMKQQSQPMEDPRIQSGYVTYKGQRAHIGDLSTIPETMLNEVEIEKT